MAECFVPYKEVLPIYDAGMKVPDDVTLVWPDDNYGYIRRLATEAEKKRPGGSGVYYHFSYWGSPHSYLWLETNSLGLAWEELHKAYENDSKTLWVVNVGDLKPAEIATTFFAELAWNPLAMGPNAQAKFLDRFGTETFGDAGKEVAELQAEYYRLASRRKPEHLMYDYAGQLTPKQLSMMVSKYHDLMDLEAAVSKKIPADRGDAYFEMVGYPCRMLAATGLLYLGVPAEQQKWMDYVHAQTADYNTKIAGGKWKGMMSDVMEGLAWPTSVGGKWTIKGPPPSKPVEEDGETVDAAVGATGGDPVWRSVAGLGWSGRAVIPIVPMDGSPWIAGERFPHKPLTILFDRAEAGVGTFKIHFLPTMKITAGGHLRVSVQVDNGTPKTIDVPGGEAGSENAAVRSHGVVFNRVTADFDSGPLPPGRHHLEIIALDAGVVIDQIELPRGATAVK